MKMISLQNLPQFRLPCVYRDRGQRWENSDAPGPSQIIGFSVNRSLKKREKTKKSTFSYLLSPLSQGAPIETAKSSLLTACICQSLYFTLNFAYSSPASSFSFSLPFSSSQICRHIQRVHELMVFSKFPGFFFVCLLLLLLFFFLSSWPRNLQFPAEINAGCSIG